MLKDHITTVKIGRTEIRQISYLDFCTWVTSEAARCEFSVTGLPFLFLDSAICECARESSRIKFIIERCGYSNIASLSRVSIEHPSIWGDAQQCQAKIQSLTYALAFAFYTEEQMQGVQIQVLSLPTTPR